MKEIVLSVHGLVDFLLRRGSIDNRIYNNASMAEGSRIHLRYQKIQGGTYLSEEALEISYQIDDYLFKLNGRADGVILDKVPVIDEIKTTINNNLNTLNTSINNVNAKIDSFQRYNASTYLPLTGGRMSGGIVFGMKGGEEKIQELPGIGYNGQNLVLSCPDSGYISFWGSLSNEYGANTPGITWLKPTITENGKVPVFNYANNQLMWKTYNAGSLSYTTADYKKYYILGITEDSYNGRDIGETKYIADDGNIETNVYVSRKNVYANAFYASSDIELKTDVKHIDASTYIPDVIQFRWLDTSELSYGFIAQDLEEHGLSYLMDKDDLNHWRVNYSAAISLVVGDLQKSKKDHEQRISDLETENNKLKKTLEKLEKRLEKLEKSK